MARLRLSLAGLFVLSLSGALLAQLPTRGKPSPYNSRYNSGYSTGRFDYYLLSLSWAPEFCAQPGAVAGNRQECAEGQAIGFVVHGLWPEANEGTGPESCARAKPVAKAVIKFILPYMPSAALIQHEWSTHGTCTGLTPADYFSTVVEARSAVQIPVEITSIEEAAKESPGDIEAQFAGLNSAFPAGAFRAQCRNGALTEVRVCFDKDLKPRSCAANAGECAATSITILPPR